MTGAAGAVGALVGQIAKMNGCYVVGSCSPDKVKYCKGLGYDAVLSYRDEEGKDKKLETMIKEIKEVCPFGINCYFDNTGGVVTDAVIINLAQFARLSICGQISHYNAENPSQVVGIPMFLNILSKQATVQGFIVAQFKPWNAGLSRLARWIKEDKLKVQEHVVDGFVNMRKAFFDLFKGANLGKAIIKLH